MLHFVVSLSAFPSVIDDSVESVLWWIELFTFSVFRMEIHFTGCVSSHYTLKPRHYFRGVRRTFLIASTFPFNYSRY